MKTVLAAITLSVMSLSAANALNFLAVDNATGNSDQIYSAQAGDGFVNKQEAKRAGIPLMKFHSADANGDGKLTPTEFKKIL